MCNTEPCHKGATVCRAAFYIHDPGEGRREGRGREVGTQKDLCLTCVSISKNIRNKTSFKKKTKTLVFFWLVQFVCHERRSKCNGYVRFGFASSVVMLPRKCKQVACPEAPVLETPSVNDGYFGVSRFLTYWRRKCNALGTLSKLHPLAHKR